MPVSDINNIAPILAEIVKINPKTIFELGIGYGKYGVLCREVLEAVHGRISYDDRRVVIGGAEGFPAYESKVWDAYDYVIIGDFVNLSKELVGKDLILAIDSLEHLEKDVALSFLAQLVNDNKYVIVSVPLGECPQGEVFGNTYEKHRSTWYGNEFTPFHHKTLHEGVCKVVCIKGNYNASA